MKRFAHRFRTLFPNVHRHGVGKVLYSAFLKALARRLRLKVLRCHHVAQVAPAFVHVPPDYTVTFLAGNAIQELTSDPELEISERFVEEALEKGDKCLGLSHDGGLSAYSWYATSPTRFLPGLRLHFARDYVYMYKAFTRGTYRGRRLYPAGVMRALRHYRSIGYKGMLAYVEATNLDSLKSCGRMGFEIFGSIYVLEAFGRYFVYASPGCARFGFYVADSLESAHAGLRPDEALRARSP